MDNERLEADSLVSMDTPEEPSDAPDILAVDQDGPVSRQKRTRISVEYALVFVLLGVSMAVVVTVFFGPRLGGLVISLTLIAAAIARLIAVEPSPRGLVVRSRVIDISTLLALAVSLAFLGQTAQSL